MTISPVSLSLGAAPGKLSSNIQTVVQLALEQQRLVGAVILVARDGELLYQQAAGWADRESCRAMTVDTIFRLASVSKPITSTAALVLVAQRHLDLDDSIDRWLPEFRPGLPDGRPARITVRQLLSHTAGLGYRFFEPDMEGPYARAGVSDGMDATGISLEENLRRIGSVPLLYQPGTAWGYSLATDVLGALIERVQGVPLNVAVSELVTLPLGLKDTDFFVHEAQRVATAYTNGTPQPHRLKEGEVVPAFEDTIGICYSPSRIFDRQAFPSGGAGMAATAGDFLHLLETLRQGGGNLLPSALIAEMERDQTQGYALPAAPGFGFGLGFSVLRDRELAMSPESEGTWRWGGAYGHSWFVDRAQGLSVVAFTNTLYEGMSGRFVTDLRDAVYSALEAR